MLANVGRVTLLDSLRSRTEAMLTALDALVSIESPTADAAACDAAAKVAADLGQELLGEAPTWVAAAGRHHLHWSFAGARRVVLIGHLDTVWPMGTLARWPFDRVDDTATGPGIFDMKAGVIQCLYALSALDDLSGIDVLLTTDEEVGSPSSRPLVEDVARGAVAALVLEPSAGGALKTARKGVSLYELSVQGRAAHAGLEPEKGVNALVELSHQVLAARAISRPEVGTTVTPTVAAAGTTSNTVPASASMKIDSRAATVEEQKRVDRALHGLEPVEPGASIVMTGAPNRPPLPASASAALYERASRVAEALGLPPLRSIEVGGGSDGNFTAGVGTPTLDGLGAVGDGAHAEGEHVVISAMADRAALVAALVDDLRS